MPDRADQVKALANGTRLEILRLLDAPMRHFAHQESADPAAEGVCLHLIAAHFGVSQPTMSRHVDQLRRAGFVTTRRKHRWTYCRRDEAALTDYADWLRGSLNIREG